LFQSSNNNSHPTPIRKEKFSFALKKVAEILNVKLAPSSMRRTYLSLTKSINGVLSLHGFRTEDYDSVIKLGLMHNIPKE